MNNIPVFSLIVAVLLILLGVAGYVVSDMASVTALIPAFLGVALAVCGALAFKPSLRKHVMHVAMLIALIGIVGSVGGILQLGDVMAGTADRPLASVVRSITAVMMIVYMVVGVRSFIQARRARIDSTPSQLSSATE